jgi:quercetin dioxygenase-like cupin family protein
VTANIRDLLPLYALGALDADEAAAVETAIAADPSLAAELDAYLDVAPIATPAPDVEARLMASIGGGAYESFSARVATLLDVTVDRARELLGLVERKASWVHPVPGIHLVHFEGGPAYAAADCGFVRIEPGCTFPWHTHLGEEVSVILQGSVRDRSGKVLSAGDELVAGEGTEHDLVAGTEGALYVARAMNGIEIAGQRQ